MVALFLGYRRGKLCILEFADLMANTVCLILKVDFSSSQNRKVIKDHSDNIFVVLTDV